jgi:hypothetical protein
MEGKVMAKTQDFVIDPEIRDYMPACDDKTDAELERQLLEEGGAREKIIVWKETNIVIDGNRRYRICKRHGLPFDVKYLSFDVDDRPAVLHWMDRLALGRRNLSPAEQAVRYARMCEYERSKSGGNAVHRVAEGAGVSDRTVHRANAYVKALESLPPDIQNKIRSERIKASHEDVIALANLPHMHQITALHNVEVGTFKSLHKALFGSETAEKSKPPKTDKVSVSKPPELDGYEDEPEVHDDLEDEEEDYGQCPNCAGKKWDKGEAGVTCAKCKHPHGEPTGGVDVDRIATQRSKTVKTVEALIRAFDDLNLLSARPKDHAHAIATCKILLNQAKGWQQPHLKEAV